MSSFPQLVSSVDAAVFPTPWDDLSASGGGRAAAAGAGAAAAAGAGVGSGSATGGIGAASFGELNTLFLSPESIRYNGLDDPDGLDELDDGISSASSGVEATAGGGGGGSRGEGGERGTGAAAAGEHNRVPPLAGQAPLAALDQWMDSWMAQTKANLMELASSQYNQLMQQTGDTFESKSLAHAARVSHLNSQIDALKIALSDSKAQRRMQDQISRRMVSAWAIKQRQLTATKLASRFFQAWKAHTASSRIERQRNRAALAWGRNKMFARVFSAWRNVARVSRKVAEELFWREQLKRVSQKLIDGYEARLAAKDEQIAAHQLQIRMQKNDQGVLEEKMMEAFMRGVSALNQEAQGLFHPEKYRNVRIPDGKLPSHQNRPGAASALPPHR